MIGGAGTCGGFVVVGDWSGGFAGGAVRVGGVARGIVRQWFGAEGGAAAPPQGMPGVLRCRRSGEGDTRLHFERYFVC